MSTGNIGLQQTNVGPALDSTIKQAFARYQTNVSSFRKGQARRYDLELVGVTKSGGRTSRKIAVNSSPYTANNRSNEQFHKLESHHHIQAEKVV